jgi:hypothetical protein
MGTLAQQMDLCADFGAPLGQLDGSPAIGKVGWMNHYTQPKSKTGI